MEWRGLVMVKEASSPLGATWRIDRRVEAHCRPVTTIRCDACRRCEPLSGIIRRVTGNGTRVPPCYDCYEAQTGGAYCGQDEYWDGRRWIPLAAGE
jgi:hypothetical protein